MAPILIFPNFVKFYLFFIFAYPKHFMRLACVVKNLNFGGSVWEGKSYCGTPNFCYVCLIFIIYPFRKFNLSSSNSLKVEHFGEPDLGGFPKPGTPDFSRTSVLPDIFNSSKFEYRAFSGLKVDSGIRKRKKIRKQMQNQKNSFQVWVYKKNQTKGG